MFIIYLDIDGVLNNYGDVSNIPFEDYKSMRMYFREKYDTFFLYEPNIYNFVEFVNKFKEVTNFKCILSSTWRYSSDSIEKLNLILSDYGCVDRELIIDKTDTLHDFKTHWTRGNQIKRSVRKYKPTGYFIVDDDTYDIQQKGHLYRVNGKHGFTKEDIDNLYNKCFHEFLRRV